MGYSEVRCQLCGVSFNIGRMRQVGEPLSAGWAWAEQNLYLNDNFVTRNSYAREQCSAEGGCSDVRVQCVDATKRHPGYRLVEPDSRLLQEEVEKHSDWEPDSEDEYRDDEPLEWDESCDDSNSEAASVEDDVSQSSEVSNVDSESASNGGLNFDMPEAIGAVFDNTGIRTEHLAGPGCVRRDGYNGNNISAEEMVGSDTVQCLIRKRRHWQSDPTDEELEIKSKYFLSGLGGYMKSRDYGGVKIIPIRHDLEEEIYPDDIYWDETDLEDSTPMPFHPTCFEVFRRVSCLKFGFVHVNGLAYWRRFWPQKAARSVQDPVVYRGARQMWNHESGDEWLAANPLLIPRLPDILRQAVHEEGLPLDTRSSAFKTARSDAHLVTSHEERPDLFCSLPQELKFQILEYLDPKDIATLRLSSRAFTELPISLWKRLLRKEMPWLWEVYDSTVPSTWASIAFPDLNAEIERIKQTAEELRELQAHYQEILTKEMPEICDEYYADNPWILENIENALPEALQHSIVALVRDEYIYSLPQDRTNWYEVYSLITKHWGDLKGLKNRKRIWEACEDIVRQIQEIEEEGLLKDG
jgi:hypothetical protein